MKTRLFSLLLVTILAAPAMTGCQMARTVESAGRGVAQGVEAAGNSIKEAVETTTATVPGNHTNPVLTLEEAQNIALKHAGFTADQVTLLHTEYEIEHGIPQYDVEFHHGKWEYDYEIHADTGEILSYSKDD
ncbi:MAG: PepSY domain-containing protein [Oscillospiraceae bacterium]|nr:PepSY domain-containing protein [Oscillospiraceae bacterium]